MSRILILLVTAVWFINGKVIIINRINGNDTFDCLLGKVPCRDLNYVFLSGASYLNDTIVTLDPGIHTINKHFVLENINNLSLTSLNSTIECRRKNSGITVKESKEIFLQNITFNNCGVRHISTEKSPHNIPHDELNVYIALCFVCCEIISIQHCSFVNNKGRALSFYNVNKKINVSNCVFENNTNRGYRERNDKYISGGGIYIEYTQCNATTNFSCSKFPNYNKNTSIFIYQSVFRRNIADNRYNDKIEVSTKKLIDSYRTFGRGGGIGINMFSTAENINVTVYSCLFIENLANWGAGLSVTFKDFSQLNSLIIENSTFLKNNATYAGGGVRIETLYQHFNGNKSVVSAGNFICLSNSTFFQNYAILGGALSDLGSTRLLYLYNNASRNIIIKYCYFTLNYATIGFAIALNTIHFDEDLIGPGISTIRAQIIDCNLSANDMIYTEDSNVVGQGALYSDQYTVVFSGTNIIDTNTFSAIVLDSSSLTFDRFSITYFHRNKGFKGGALALYGLSWLMFKFKSEVLFKSNIADEQGGAIYIKPAIPQRLSFQTTLLFTEKCVFRYEEDIEPDNWQINVTFDSNKCLRNSYSGNSIYASTLQHCRSDGTPRVDKKLLNWKSFTFQNTNDNKSEVVTDAVNIELSNLAPFPNLPFSPSIKITDEKEQNTYATIDLIINSVDDPLSFESFAFHTIHNLPNLRIKEQVDKAFVYKVQSINGPLFEIPPQYGIMQQCPIGFRPNKQGDSCICMDSENGDVLKCFEDNSTILILDKKWGFSNSEGLLQLVACPLHFCRCNGRIDEYKCMLNISRQCIDHRNGTLCGECETGYSVKVGNEDCEKCPNTNLYLFIVFVVIGIPIFVIFLLLMNCDAISGHLDAYLFFNQMCSIILSETIKLDVVSSFVIGITSFTGTGGLFGICLFHGLDNITKLGLNYVLPLSLIAFTWIIAKIIPDKLWMFSVCCRKRKNKNVENQERKKRNFGRALSFVAVLCYSSITNTSFRIIQYVEIKNSYYVFNAPGTKYFDYPHNILLILASILIALISVGFPLMICFEKQITRICNVAVYFTPIATALQSYYKGNCKSFATFYFAIRFIALLFDMLLHEMVQKLIIFTCCFALSLSLFSAFHPYKLKIHNVLDMAIITNLIILSLFSTVINIPYALKDNVRHYLCLICNVAFWFPLIITIYRFGLTRNNNNNDRADESGTSNNSRGLVEYMPARAGEDNIAVSDNED